MDFDRLSLRALILSIALVIVTVATVIIGWFFNVDLHSTKLWVGALITFLTAGFIFTAPFYWKIGTIFVSIFVISAYLSYLFQWPFMISLIIGLVIVIFILFTYLVV